MCTRDIVSQQQLGVLGEQHPKMFTYSMSAILISSWMRTEGGKSTAGRKRCESVQGWERRAGSRPHRTPTSVHKEVDLGEDVLQSQAFQCLQLHDF